MKKILSTLALAGLAGSSLAFAEIDGLNIKAKVGFESEYIFRGKEHSDENVQTKVQAEYALPVQGIGASVYAGAFLMSPLTQAANEADLFTGVKTEIEKFQLEAGYTYYGYPNRNGSTGFTQGGAVNPATNRAVYTDSHEISVGAAYSGMADIVTPSLYFHYNFDLEQLTTEAALRRSFKGDTIGIAGAELIVAGFAGYVDARAYNGDNRQGVEQWMNSYAYIGTSVDVAYSITNASKVGIGLRYTWNTDGDYNDAGALAGDASGLSRLDGNTSTNFWYGIWAEFRY